MANDTLFTNVRIFDGSGAAPYAGEVLIQDKRIARVGTSARFLPTAGVTVIDGAGAFLMPGMVEAHTHFSWNDQPSLDSIQMMPPEEHVLWCASVAKKYLDMGWTSCVGAAAAKPRLDVVIRNAINAGMIPGPRYLAAGQEITVIGGLGDTTLPHLPYEEFAFGALVSGVEEMRKTVRTMIKYGVDSIKINLSGESITGMPSEQSQFSEQEIAVCVAEAKQRGRRVSAHARACWAVKMCVKHGIEVIYHASYTDTEALDLVEANKHKHFIAPGLAWLIRTCHDASDYGITPEVAKRMGYFDELEAAIASMRALHRRGVHILPGGDYGFAWTPHGTNAKDLEYFVKHVGMTTTEALLSATAWGGPMMRMGEKIGQIKEGYFADILLIDGDPLADITILQNKEKILAVMKDGEFHRAPEVRQSRTTRWAA